MAVSELDEVAGLERVLTRLAVTDDDKLEKVWGSSGPYVMCMHGRSSFSSSGLLPTAALRQEGS